MKFCKDCKHYEPSAYGGPDRCLNPKFVRPVDLVRGEQGPTFCEPYRMPSMPCGPEAKGFEAKTITTDAVPLEKLGVTVSV